MAETLIFVAYSRWSSYTDRKWTPKKEGRERPSVVKLKHASNFFDKTGENSVFRGFGRFWIEHILSCNLCVGILIEKLILNSSFFSELLLVGKNKQGKTSIFCSYRVVGFSLLAFGLLSC